MLDELTPDERAERIESLFNGGPLGRGKKAVAEEFGITPQAITGWVKSGTLLDVNKWRLTTAAGLPIEYLIFRDWEAAAAARGVSANDAEWTDIRDARRTVGMGQGQELSDEYVEARNLKFRADSLQRKGLKADKLEVWYAKGDSMLPRIRAGDAVMFNLTETSPQDGHIYVVFWRGEYYAKRAEVLDDCVYFKADNREGDHQWRRPKWKDSPKDPIQVIGRVCWIGSWEG